MSNFSDAYKAFAKIAGANKGAYVAGQYVSDVENAINELSNDINNLRFNVNGQVGNRLIDDLKGRAAEQWHKGTFNIDAVVKGDPSRVSKIIERGREGLGEPDLKGSWGAEYGAKYYKNAEETAKQQAKSVWERYQEYLAKCNKKSGEPLSYEEYVASLKNTDKNAPLYEGQYRLIPSDQLEQAKEWLKRKIEEESGIHPEQVIRYQDALDKLTDRIKNNEGVASLPLTESEAQEMAKLLKEGGFDPAEFGLTTEELIKWQNIMEQAFNAGLTAAVISVVLEVAPEIINIITNLIKNGEIDENDFKCLGFAALKGGTLGYIRGTVAAALTIACKAGKLGASLKNAHPSIIGAVVVLTMNGIQNAVLVSFGKMTKSGFANKCIEDLTLTSCAMAFGFGFQKVFGTVLQALLPQLPVLGFMLGSFIGSAVGSFIYKTSYSCVLSYCIDTGCTFFGLVEQDYTLPEDILKEMGLQVFEYEKFVPKQLSVNRFESKQFVPKQLNAKRISLTILRRGIIAVNCIGYV